MKQRTRILVVDDESIVRESISEWLGDVGYQVVTAESGAEALQIIRKNKIKIIHDDLNMSGMDGIALMKNARTIVTSVSTIIITA